MSHPAKVSMAVSLTAPALSCASLSWPDKGDLLPQGDLAGAAGCQSPDIAVQRRLQFFGQNRESGAFASTSSIRPLKLTLHHAVVWVISAGQAGVSMSNQRRCRAGQTHALQLPARYAGPPKRPNSVNSLPLSVRMVGTDWAGPGAPQSRRKPARVCGSLGY